MENNPNFIVLHCAATKDEGWGFTAEDVDGWHKKRGFKSPSGIHIGYHFYIRRNGLIEKGRPTHERGAHTKYHNTDSIGICYDGTKKMTYMQIESFIKLYLELSEEFGIEPHNVFGHNEFDEHLTRECPNVQMNIMRVLLSYAVEKQSDQNLS